jgi:two-component system, OmpR family, phosphate regulon sensor histidine kinase PhoR
MNQRSINNLVILAILSVVGIIITQVYWLDAAYNVQKQQVSLRNKQLAGQAKQFNERVTIALSNVANEILTIKNDPAKIFQAVKLVRPNYFTVAINDTLQPFLLENLLKREFSRRNIKEDFEYGIYDCFTDSIVYGNFIALDDDSTGIKTKSAPRLDWVKDGHYFSLYFPNKEIYEPQVNSPPLTTWTFSVFIILIVFSFFGYSVYIILRQKRLSQMKSDFINNMTHELKTPISTISLTSEVLMKSDIINQPERLKHYATIIHEENNRLKKQVDRVLQLAYLEKDKISLHFEQVDMHQLITNAVRSQKIAIEEKGGTIEIFLQAKHNIIKVDPVHISNIVINLLDNANKYTVENPKIEITTSNEEGYIVIKVKDNGIGMDKNVLNIIFDKFYRVPTGNLHDVKGFGLGLYYVNMMVNEHKGKIEVESNLGKGSTFKIYLPL